MPVHEWSVEKAEELYRIRQWGLGYFSVNEEGHLCARPSAGSEHKVDLKVLVDELRKRKIDPPVLIRFMDILHDRIANLSNCFQDAISQNDYESNYYPLYPIKVNQERDVVMSILDYGRRYGLGLEAGSKAELLIVLALTTDPETPIVCNGYKDEEFVELVCMAAKMGKKIFPVIENYSELETFIRYYKKTGIIPNLGIRFKVSTKGEGKWAKTGGDASKFGLTVPEVMKAISRLKEEDLLHALKLLHFHIGSQVTKIKVVKQGIVETARVFVEMIKMGASLEYIDIGGGLGVDYDGSETSHATINYSTREYAGDIIYRIKQICDEHKIHHPTIFSESGRFIAAHYSLLITNISAVASQRGEGPEMARPENGYGPIQEMYEAYEFMDESNIVECYHDVLQYRTEALNLFNLGYLSLPARAYMEELFWKTMRKILKFAKKTGNRSPELVALSMQLTDTYFANFSVFQSLPDAWAIQQVFPIVPIHRLDAYPDRRAVIVDLTCDSDGLIESYIGDHEASPSMRLHSMVEGEQYYIGFFMVGAYQETLGELHNLFGDTHAVQIEITGENNYRIRGLVQGDTIDEMIGYKSYNRGDLLQPMREQIEMAVERHNLTLDESAQLMNLFETGLRGYTYFED